MDADIHCLYQSDFYQILDFKCRCRECGTSKPEYADVFTVSFVRTGTFHFNVFRRSYDAYSSRVIVNKAGFEHTVTHVPYSVTDECTIFEFKHSFYEILIVQHPHPFFFNNDLHSLLLNSSAELDFLHFSILQKIKSGDAPKLMIDEMVTDIIRLVLSILTNDNSAHVVTEQVKKYHLPTIEKAKHYLNTHYTDDIALVEIASYCNVSAFHFSRLFKLITGYSPYFYLQNIRLKNAEFLLKTTALPVTDICFSSGFNSLDHFSTAFKKKYKYSPSRLRLSVI